METVSRGVAMPGRLAAHVHRTTYVVHVYATSRLDAEVALVAAARIAPGAAVRVHVDGAEGRGATGRPVLMALLAEAVPGDIVCGAAAAFTSAPPRARTRLAAVVKARDIGLALLEDAASMAQIAGGATSALSLHALKRAIASGAATPAPAVLGRATPIAAPALAPEVEVRVLQLLNAGQSWRQVQTQIGVSRHAIAKCAKRLAAVETAQSQAAFARSRAAGFSRDDRADDGFDSAP